MEGEERKEREKKRVKKFRRAREQKINWATERDETCVRVNRNS